MRGYGSYAEAAAFPHNHAGEPRDTSRLDGNYQVGAATYVRAAGQWRQLDREMCGCAGGSQPCSSLLEAVRAKCPVVSMGDAMPTGYARSIVRTDGRNVETRISTDTKV